MRRVVICRNFSTMPYKTLTSVSLALLCIFLSSCHGHITIKEDLPEQQESVTKSVADFADTVSADITRNGIEAWLKHFSQSPNFYMASAGERVFPSYDS